MPEGGLSLSPSPRGEKRARTPMRMDDVPSNKRPRVEEVLPATASSYVIVTLDNILSSFYAGIGNGPSAEETFQRRMIEHINTQLGKQLSIYLDKLFGAIATGKGDKALDVILQRVLEKEEGDILGKALVALNATSPPKSGVAIEIMMQALTEKFDSFPAAKNALLQTGNRTIVEAPFSIASIEGDARNFWTFNRDADGIPHQGMMGVLLEKIRSTL